MNILLKHFIRKLKSFDKISLITREQIDSILPSHCANQSDEEWTKEIRLFVDDHIGPIAAIQLYQFVRATLKGEDPYSVHKWMLRIKDGRIHRQTL